jgi:hypothetical protein
MEQQCQYASAVHANLTSSAIFSHVIIKGVSNLCICIRKKEKGSKPRHDQYVATLVKGLLERKSTIKPPLQVMKVVSAAEEIRCLILWEHDDFIEFPSIYAVLGELQWEVLTSTFQTERRF